MSKGGFTLLEVMVAVAVTAMILSIVYSTFARTIESKDYVELGNEAYHKARWAMDKITLDLASSFVHPSRSSNTLFYGLSHEINGMPMDEIHFTSFAHVQLNPNVPASDQCEISYKVAWIPELERFQLWRREDPVIDDQPMSGGEELVILDDMFAFNLRYYDALEWRDQWDSRPFDDLFDEEGNPIVPEVNQTDEMIKAVPVAAEVTLAVMGPSLRPIVFTSKVKIELSPIDLNPEDEDEEGGDVDSKGAPSGGKTDSKTGTSSKGSKKT